MNAGRRNPATPSSPQMWRPGGQPPAGLPPSERLRDRAADRRAWQRSRADAAAEDGWEGGPGQDRDWGPLWRGTLAVVLVTVLAALAFTLRPDGDGSLVVEDAAPVAPSAQRRTAPAGGSSPLDPPPIDPTWHELAATPLGPREGHTAVWTGREAVLWGGRGADGAVAGDGAAYDPIQGTWRPLAAAPPEVAARAAHVAVWTGQEMLVWGGSGAGGALADGAAYDPAADTWRLLPAAPVPGRFGHRAVWTGQQLIVWGGEGDSGELLADGAVYSPAAGDWRRLAAGPLEGRRGFAAAWTADELVIWGGADAGGGFRATGAAYELAADRWRELPAAPLEGRADHSATPVDGNVLVWGGRGVFGQSMTATYADGAVYEPASDRWTALPSAQLSARRGHAALPAGDGLVVWGGDRREAEADGALYDPVGHRWLPVPRGPLTAGPAAPAVWTGSALLVWSPEGRAAVWTPAPG